MQIRRIKPPMYKINDDFYNEYELRQLMLDIAKKQYVSEFPVTVTDSNGKVAIISEKGQLSELLAGLEIIDNIALEHFLISKELQ